MTHTHTIEYYLSIKKEENHVICNNRNGPWGHCPKWNKSEKGGQLYGITYTSNLNMNENKTIELMDIENMIGRCGGGEEGMKGDKM